ncbi:uncharacterized protein LOC119652601 isoform X2 [Hermetia illucens]|uniref:uncharacterized protein LOC119652601 isoform X2 n=1 Tax=Hermetia illucens TaxID=343691 RepID=UPI0018CC4098|nr:uncharacterized protein LOC119652601 isoform X2 [Hermetia illucens]
MAEPASQGDSVVAQSPEVKNALKTTPDTQIPVMTRERSFIRTSNNQNNIKRRSLALNQQISAQQYSNPIRGKPAMELYRPPTPGNILQNSKSTANIPQMQVLGRHGVAIPNMGGHRAILVSHPIHVNQLGVGVTIQSSQLPLVNSPSSGNILHQSSHRVKFSHEFHMPQNSNSVNNQQILQNHNGPGSPNSIQLPIQRSKSLSSADVLARGSAGLGLALGNDATDIGKFPPDVQGLIDKAMNNPNELNARCLMELTHQIMQRAVEGRRYALPMSRLCIAIIAKEIKETFLEALLNTCRQWYQEREKVLYSIQGMKSPSRTRFTSFMSFLTEMFCQLKRRQLQIHSHNKRESPALILLSLLSKCCEDCVKPPVRSLSEIECLFFVLTCIGRDLETHLPQQLEALLSSVRDAFLNSSAPTIRRTLLQLIELQASRWQLPGNTVLYYYPSTK